MGSEIQFENKQNGKSVAINYGHKGGKIQTK